MVRSWIQRPYLLVIAFLFSTASIGIATDISVIHEVGNGFVSLLGHVQGQTDDGSFEEIQVILDAIPTGKEALSVWKGYEVKVTFEGGSGSAFRRGSNLVIMDSDKSPLDAALTFVHEMVHAQHYHEGRTAEAQSFSRDEYVQKRLEEEAEAESKSINAKIELSRLGIDVSNAQSLFEQAYVGTFEVEVAMQKARHPQLSNDDLNRLGEEVAKKSIVTTLRLEKAVTSRDGKSYAAFYGSLWDSKHNID